MTVNIIMATYNSNGYVKDQIISILSQTYCDFKLLIRDDGSTDNTVEDIMSMAAIDERIILIEDNIESKGVGENFKNILRFSEADYIFLADQDDVWHENKLEELLCFAKENFIAHVPCIAYAPGRVVDANLVYTEKLTDYSLKIERLEDMFLMNGGVQGCAMLINKEMRNIVLRQNFKWHMHDQVLSLYAICFGKIFYLNKELFLYRQHSHNVVGYNSNSVFSKIKKYFSANTSLINSTSLDLFHVFYKSEKNNLAVQDESKIINFLRAVDCNKFKFLCYVLNENVRLHKSFLQAFLKSLFVTKIVQDK
ncbi:glycosyltransferase [Pectobacterium actinidiae]|uniref:glycosyltransferase n=1 Tax=Pectobacterium actinidiae TaxID=1507808 RepID=UPI00380280EE